MMRTVTKDQTINDTETSDRQWRCLKGRIKQALTETVPKIEQKKKNEWMTDEILNMMNARQEEQNGKDLRAKSDWNPTEPKRNGNYDKCAEIENLKKRKNM